MFLIWGVRRYVQQVAVLVARCSLQGHSAAHRLVKRRTKFTLFFVPLFTVGTKHFLACTLCGHSVEVPGTQVPGIVAEAQRQQIERAGAPQYAPYDAPVQQPGPN
jgi:hypothetical protein